MATLDTSFYQSSTFAAMVNHREQELILLPTEECNFRCTYCYEDFKGGRMAAHVVEGIKSLISRRASELDLLKVSWFGGEPLLEQRTIEEISRHAQLTSIQNPSLKYYAEMTTNGFFLTAKVAANLAALGIKSYQVSLDGSSESHDMTRIRRDKQGTFNTLWRNLKEIRETSIDLSLLLRIHVYPTNYAKIDEFLAHLQDEFGSDSRFSVLLKPIERLGGPQDGQQEILSESQRMHLHQTYSTRPPSSLKITVWTPRANRGLKVCYAAKPNSLVIRADGSVGKCTVALADSRNRIGWINPDGTLDICQASLAPWIRGISSLNTAALECPRRDIGENLVVIAGASPTV